MISNSLKVFLGIGISINYFFLFNATIETSINTYRTQYYAEKIRDELKETNSHLERQNRLLEENNNLLKTIKNNQ